MGKEISGVLVLNEYSVDNGSTWKVIMCEDTSQISGTSTVNEKKTKCGTFTNTSNNPVTITGSGVAVGDLATNQASYQDLQKLRDAQTIVKFRRRNAVSGTITAGEITFFMGDGRFTEATETSPTEEVTSFNWAWTSTGPVDFDVNS